MWAPQTSENNVNAEAERDFYKIYEDGSDEEVLI